MATLFEGLAGFCNDCSTNGLNGLNGLLGGFFGGLVGNAVTNATSTASASEYWLAQDRDVVYARWTNGQTDTYSGQQLMQWAVAGQQQMPAALQQQFQGLVERAHELEWQRQMAAQQQPANNPAPQQGEDPAQWQVPSGEAQKKARELLERHLTPEQRESLKMFGHFEVVGQSRKVYRIKRGQVANVFEVDVKDGQRRNVVQLCAQPQVVRVPDEDAMLAQKLYLECDEAGFLAIANKQRLAA